MDIFGMHEECGVFGIYDKSATRDLVYETYRALYALQHRGQESAGIAINVDGILYGKTGMGLVSEVFDKQTLASFKTGAKMATGHVRYATSGARIISNSQPMIVHHSNGSMALCHNGNLTNTLELRHVLESRGSIFHGTSDTEVITHLITLNRLKSHSVEEALMLTMQMLSGAFSLVLMSSTKLICARDPHGFRPLCIGKLDNDEGYVFASESAALDVVGATLVRDVSPGEIVIADINGLRTIDTLVGTAPHNICVFEYMYFARPDSIIEGTCVHEARLQAGRFLAQEYPVDADVVIGAPDSGVPAAQGFAQESGIPFVTGIVKNKYVGRSFIQGSQKERKDTVRIKLNPIPSSIEGKRVVLVDDSVVRGTTCKRLISLLRRTGAVEVHLRVSSPPFRHPCYFGTDVPDEDLLIANNMSIEEIKDELGCDSLGYLSLKNSKNLAINSNCDFCMGCFTGKYPVDPPKPDLCDIHDIPLSKSQCGKIL